MESDELVEAAEKGRESGQRLVGLTTAVVAALLAVVTLMGHRLHTEEVVSQTRSADGWAYYQAKNGRYHLYSTDAQLAQLIGGKGEQLAESWKKKAESEQRESEDIRRENEARDLETEALARRATFFDASEICLEVAIVLCSLSLLTGNRSFWQISFLATIAGIVAGVLGFLKH